MTTDAAATLATFAVPGKSLYLVGAYDRGVTVFSQQVRALNLAWALVESRTIRTIEGAEPLGKRLEIAIVGGGFAGLTLAAALLKKHVHARITLLEQRDTLLPLQQGSDSRWLHPRIYEWPADGSGSSAALLPVLNWTAGRASDVVVQVLAEWTRTVREVQARLDTAETTIRLYCNARHLQIREPEAPNSKVSIEWVGEERGPLEARSQRDGSSGQSEPFDMVVLAVGFGVERDGGISYWRNETLGQPSLESPRQNFIVSGQGDGAMIDLLRLCISQFRQDRILEELYADEHALVEKLKQLQMRYITGIEANLFDAFEFLPFNSVVEKLGSRLRRDTNVILHLKVRRLSELFASETSRISFQNKLLVYLLYRCGGFVPSTMDIKLLARIHAVPTERLVLRHGPDREAQLMALLSGELYSQVIGAGGTRPEIHYRQPEEVRWPGGYFGYPGITSLAGTLSDEWKIGRREYLPGATSIMAASFCSAVAGLLLASHPAGLRLRVTLHRSAHFGGEEVLQQACDYFGTVDSAGDKPTAARTFPTQNATIGLAWRTQRIVRAKRGVDRSELAVAMQALQLNEASRRMAGEVSFVLAIPLLETPSIVPVKQAVAGVLYIDSTADQYFVEDEQLRVLVSMGIALLEGLSDERRTKFNRVRNLPPPRPTADASAAILPSADGALEIVGSVSPPATLSPFQFNFDHSDFTDS